MFNVLPGFFYLAPMVTAGAVVLQTEFRFHGDRGIEIEFE